MNAVMQEVMQSYDRAFRTTREEIEKFSKTLLQYLPDEVHKVALQCLKITPHVVLAVALTTELFGTAALIFWAARTIIPFLIPIKDLFSHNIDAKIGLKQALKSVLEFHSNLIPAIGIVATSAILKTQFICLAEFLARHMQAIYSMTLLGIFTVGPAISIAKDYI